MPSFKADYNGTQIGSFADCNDPFFTLEDGQEYTSPPIEIIGRKDKMLYVIGDVDLDIELYIVPERTMTDDKWLLYKTGLVANAGDPFMYFSNDVMPFIAVKISNNSGGPAASIKSWLFAQ